MFQALRNRNVGLLFAGQVVSVVGDLVLFVALPFWVYRLTGSAMATGFMFVALTIPQLLVSPVAGVFVDRLDRKRLMIASDIVRALLMLCYFFVNTADQVWLIYVLAFAESAVSQFFRPSVVAVVPTLVDGEEELTRANAALSGSWALGQLGGPALGGVLVAVFGPHGAALFDAGTYVISAALVLAMHVPVHAGMTGRGAARGEIAQLIRSLEEGVRVVLARPILRVVFASLAILFLCQGILNVLLIVLVSKIWGVGAAEFGWLISAQGVGALVGTALIGQLAARVAPKHLVVGGAVAGGLLLGVIVNQSNYWIAVALLAVASIGIVAFDVGLTTLLQLGTDDANRGRVSGLMQMTIAASQLIAIGATSLFADQVGALVMLDLAAALFALGGLVAILAPPMPQPSPSVVAQPAE